MEAARTAADVTMGQCQPLLRCLACDKSSLEPVLDLGNAPLANGYGEQRENLRFPLQLFVCPSCWHGQIGVVVDPSLLFCDYAYRSGVSTTWKRHCQQLVAYTKHFVSGPRNVLDIGANDGTLLSVFRRMGDAVLGIDPAEGLLPEGEQIPFRHAFWNSSLAQEYRHEFSVIAATNVLAHVADPLDFLRGCRVALRPRGIVLLEFPWVKSLLRNTEFDTIYHEHLSYWSLHSFARLATRAGLKIANVQYTRIHGGSLRVVLVEKTPSSNLDELLAIERRSKIPQIKTWQAFAKRAQRVAVRLQTATKGASPLFAFGAAAKGTIAVHYTGVRPQLIVDDTPSKQGRCLPGTDIPIIGASSLEPFACPLTWWILPWNFAREVISRLKALRPWAEDRYLVHVPRVRELTPKGVSTCQK